MAKSDVKENFTHLKSNYMPSTAFTLPLKAYFARAGQKQLFHFKRWAAFVISLTRKPMSIWVKALGGGQ